MFVSCARVWVWFLRVSHLSLCCCGCYLWDESFSNQDIHLLTSIIPGDPSVDFARNSVIKMQLMWSSSDWSWLLSMLSSSDWSFLLRLLSLFGNMLEYFAKMAAALLSCVENFSKIAFFLSSSNENFFSNVFFLSSKPLNLSAKGVVSCLRALNLSARGVVNCFRAFAKRFQAVQSQNWILGECQKCWKMSAGKQSRKEILLWGVGGKACD